ncbi:MAG: single-stranded-DNA-specific exonuclease RecJ [Syntrophus sp. (in: bacteria)]|nr:single-stranded-DNA-specific exonuclease RecJ [Syntrophus sp. (in: bacteria)]
MNRDNPGQKMGTQGTHKDRATSLRSIAEDLNLPDLMARILMARGIDSPDAARAFLRPRLEDLSDPFLIPDMEKGVKRIIGAVKRKEKICLYGDYDADGVTSLVLMVNFLKHFDIEPITYIPSRQEGYGLHAGAIDLFREKGVTLLVSLDCGSSNVEEVRYASKYGIDTVIIDHHEMADEAPPAHALINPKRKDSRFPTRDLAACGVTFFFLLALRRIMHSDGLLTRAINLKKELDIVTIGTVGDMVPLIGDNRIMVKHGMEMMNKKPKAWLKSMYKSRAITKEVIDEFTLGFIIVPRINAAGRVSQPERSLNFLTSEDEFVAAACLKDLQDANKHRQSIEEKILREIVNDLKKGHPDDRNSIVVFNEKWHVGVLGIVAQKLAEMFKKPAIVITKINGIWKGSGRGSGGMDLFETITALSPLLLKYGGHRYACGISLEEENLVRFADAFEKSVKSNGVIVKKLEINCDSGADFEELTTELMEYIGQLSPFGIGNPRPNLSLNPAQIVHLKNGRVKITDRNNRNWHGYMSVDKSIPLSDNIHIIATPVLREEMGRQFINLNIKEIAETPFNQ